jgi:hypothetical protein
MAAGTNGLAALQEETRHCRRSHVTATQSANMVKGQTTRVHNTTKQVGGVYEEALRHSNNTQGLLAGPQRQSKHMLP